MKRIKGADLGTAVLVLCALMITALVVRREFFPAGPPATDFFQPAPTGGALAREGRVIGRADAPIRIVEFSDFECPSCARSQKDLRRVRAMFPDSVAIVYRHLPLDSIHRFARTAAAAAECAGEQDRFEAYHDALYADQHAIGVRSWEAFAEIARVPDLSAFKTCVSQGRHLDRVERDARAAQAAGITATPTFIINGQMFSGTIPDTEWARLIRARTGAPAAR